jgi:hypothetical protein
MFDTISSFLNPSLPYTVTVTGCIVKDGVTCSKQISQVLLPPTTTTTTTTLAPSTSYAVYIEAGDLSAATGNTNTSQNGKVFVTYVPSELGVPSTAEYTASGNQGNLCVNTSYIPTIYYFASDMMVLGASSLTNVGLCSLL